MATPPDQRRNLPVQLTSFVGREADLTEVAHLLGAHRLVTLTGAGGIGKTRLALEAAAAADAPHGVWAVELASVADPAQVPREVAAALGIELTRGGAAEPDLLAGLADRAPLVVLDNCEHLVVACAALAEALLRGCPRLRLLATSRERLGVPGEAVYPVPPLAAPGADEVAPPEELPRYEAVRLFVERARLGRPGFALTQENAGSVAGICRRLDGIPLAIELAAARARALDVGEIAARLAAVPFGLLTGGRGVPRQQTLAAALDWSYDLLAEAERALVRRLSVFVGGFALDAAEAICGGQSVLDDLTGLVDKSLVIADPPTDRAPTDRAPTDRAPTDRAPTDRAPTATADGGAQLANGGARLASGGAGFRYRLLEPVRQYASGKLEEAGEAAAVRARHRDWYLDLAERSVAGMISPDQVAWFARLEAEHGNLRAALELSRLEPDPKAELRLVGALAPFWGRTKYHAEGRASIDDVLARTEAVATPAAGRARIAALDWRGFMELQGESALAERAVALAREVGDGAILSMALRHLAARPVRRAGAAALLREAIEAARAAGDARETGHAMASLARLSSDRGPTAEDDELASEAVAVLRRVGDRDALMGALRVAAEVHLRLGARDRARAELEEAAAFALQMPWYPVPHAALMLAWLDRQDGAFAPAAARLRAVVAEARGRADPTLLLYALPGVGGLAAAWGDPRAAARLFGAAMGKDIKGGTEVHDLAREVAEVRAVLGDEAFEAAWAEGQRMSPDDAAAYALGLEPPAAAPAPDDRSSPLSPREREVAALIAEGRSNREIAEALIIAEPTADRHVANILNKLGFHSRAQVAAWQTRQRDGV